jgi:hypothetical protein
VQPGALVEAPPPQAETTNVTPAASTVKYLRIR